MTIDDERVRLAIYRGFATAGRPPSLAQLADHIGSTPEDARQSMRRLAASRHLVLDADDAVVMAHPFAAVPLGAAHAWVVGRDAPPPGDQMAHFLVPVPHMWNDVVHTCGNQRLFCSDDCVDTWLGRTGHARGYVMDLATLWRLAQHWYDGRPDRGYARRDPAAAAAYFEQVGLRGDFWGL